ncbi:MAG TPA: transglutaminase family protein [Hyphomicrobiaceae bacterium]
MSDAKTEFPAERYLQPSTYIDSESPEVLQLTREALAGLDGASTTERSIRLFEAVRDGLRYDPYSFAVQADAYRASAIARQESAFCVPKAILLTACLRAAGIPAAVGFADVRNHLNSPKLADLMGTDLFIYHGYVQLWLDGVARKVTPAFNMELCERFGVGPLLFDGRSDALFHEFDADNRRHMEYVNDRGIHLDPPIDELLAAFRTTYPRLVEFTERRIAGPDAAIEDASFPGTAIRKGDAPADRAEGRLSSSRNGLAQKGEYNE